MRGENLQNIQDKRYLDLLKSINKEGFKDAKYVFNIGCVPNYNKHLYKYIKIEYARKWLEQGNGIIRFDKPTQWKDKFEIRFYTAKYDSIKEKNTPSLYELSLTTYKNSEASWLVYSDARANKCVRLVFSLSKIRKCLEACMIERYKMNEGLGKFYIGMINYDLNDDQIKAINKKYVDGKLNLLHSIIKGNENFGLHNYLSLLLIKRQIFSYEKELRIFYVPDDIESKSLDGEEPKYIDFNVLLKDALVRIDIQKTMRDKDKEFLKDWTLKHHIDCKKDNLYGEEDYNNPIVFE